MKLLEKDNFVSTHQKNLQIFIKLRSKQAYDWRHSSQFFTPTVISGYRWTESVSFLGLKIWDLVPNELKNMGNLAAFKKDIKNWSPEIFSWTLYKIMLVISVLFEKRVS